MLDPLADPPIVALLGPRLGSLGTEAGRPEQTPHVIRMVDDIEMLTDQVDDPTARPQAGAIAGRLRPGDHQASQSASLRHREFRWSTGCRPGAQASAALSPVRLLPPTDRPPVDAHALGHHMNRNIPLQQVDGTEPSPFELSRTPLWAHANPPAGEHSGLGHYLGRNH